MISTKFRLIAVLLVVFGLPAGVALAGQVTFPGTFPFVTGTPIRAAEVNGTFSAVKSAVDDNATRLATAESSLAALATLAGRVTALEAADAARRSYYAEQAGSDANASVDDVWVNIPSAVIPVTLTAPTNLRYQLFARIYNYGAAAGTTTNCSVRIVQDDLGTPLIPPAAPATLGDWNGALSAGADVPNNSRQVALGGLVNLPAGTYNLKVQVARKAMAGNSGNCSIFRWSYSRARFFVDLVP
jgi:hypothetical protein